MLNNTWQVFHHEADVAWQELHLSIGAPVDRVCHDTLHINQLVGLPLGICNIIKTQGLGTLGYKVQLGWTPSFETLIGT